MAKFNAQLINEIAMKSFLHVVDCILGNSDPYYTLGNDSSDFEQNFEEDLKEAGIVPTEGRIKKVADKFTKIRDGLVKYIDKKYV